jgi:hypothetical protein
MPIDLEHQKLSNSQKKSAFIQPWEEGYPELHASMIKRDVGPLQHKNDFMSKLAQKNNNKKKENNIQVK